MDKIELIDKFLDSKGLIWVGRKVIDGWHNSEFFDAKEEDFNKDKTCVIPVKLKNGPENFETELVLSVDLLSFISYGIGFDAPVCFALSDEYREILDANNFSEEWRAICLKEKGLVYKKAVDKLIEAEKRIASDNCHQETIKHIQAITEQTKIKKGIYDMLNELQEDINTQYKNLNN